MFCMSCRRQNRQVVFFRVVGLNDDTEALGAQGIPLTAGPSIAVDKALHDYGTPFFVEADLPQAGAGSQASFRRLMIAQDTGSAIVGPARADLYFGSGEEAGQMAGRIQQAGRFAMLVPRELGSSVTGASVPLPRAKPGPSLASYAFHPAGSPAKFEPPLGAGSLRPATPHPVVPPQAKPEQIAARTPRPTTYQLVVPAPAKNEASRGSAHTLHPDELPPPARPTSQVAVRMLRPAALRLEPPPPKHEASQVAGRAARPATLQPIPAPTKRESLRVAIHTLHPEEPPAPPAKPKPSQVAARTLHPIAPPPTTKAEPSETGAHVLRPAVLAQAKPGSSQVAPRARPPVPNLAGQESRRGAVH